jgi:hypothetical protein
MVDKERSREIRQRIRLVLMSQWNAIGASDVRESVPNTMLILVACMSYWNGERLRPT